MEAAVAAASRGHRVSLWEKNGRLGGQIHYAAKPTGKQEFLTLLDYYENQLKNKGVEVRLNQEANADNITGEKAEVVILATGSRPAEAPFPVTAPEKVLTALEVLDGAVTGKEVVVIGGGAVGCETAITLAGIGTLSAENLKFLMENEAESYETLQGLLNRGTKKVTIVELLKGVGRDIGVSTRWVVMKNINRLGVKVIDQSGVKEVNDQGVVIERDGEQSLIPADTVVLSLGARPVNDLAKILEDKVPELYLIGDAVRPGKVTEAIREGFELALKI